MALEVANASACAMPSAAPCGALPATALQHRLRTGGASLPPWAAYLPKGYGELSKRGLQARLYSQAFSSSASEASTSCASTGSLVAGRVWQLSQDEQGCRDVQHALESASSDQEREAIAAELQGHIWEAARDPHANHVVQKCVEAIPPFASQFIIDELLVVKQEKLKESERNQVGQRDGAALAAQHRFACRIVQRLLERCSADQVAEFADSLVQNAGAIARHPYGNYVLQHLLLHGSRQHRCKLEAFLEEEFHSLGEDSHGSAVLANILLRGETSLCRALAKRAMREPDKMLSMACSRHGHVAVQRLLDHLSGEELELARSQLLGSRGLLEASRFGRVVAAHLDESALSSTVGVA